jgi:hypothetical protein
VDRILSLQAVDDLALSSSLQARTSVRTDVVLQLVSGVPGAFAGLQLDEHRGVYEERLSWMEDKGCYDVRLQVRDLFYVKQRLLSCGLPFRILAPVEFRQDVADTLEAMLRFYQS